MQFFILLLGVMVFVFYEFNSAPINFNPQVVNYIKASDNKNYDIFLDEFSIIQDKKKDVLDNYILSSKLDFLEFRINLNPDLKIEPGYV